MWNPEASSYISCTDRWLFSYLSEYIAVFPLETKLLYIASPNNQAAVYTRSIDWPPIRTQPWRSPGGTRWAEAFIPPNCSPLQLGRLFHSLLHSLWRTSEIIVPAAPDIVFFQFWSIMRRCIWLKCVGSFRRRMVAFYPFPFYNLALSAGDVLLSSLGGGRYPQVFCRMSALPSLGCILFFYLLFFLSSTSR